MQQDGRSQFDLTHNYAPNGVGDANRGLESQAFTTILEHPEESEGNDMSLLNFFGLDNSHGHDRNVDLNSVSNISKQFGLQADSFDPMARQAHYPSTVESSAAQSMGDYSTHSTPAHGLADLSSDELHSALSSSFDQARHHSTVSLSTGAAPINGWHDWQEKSVSESDYRFPTWDTMARDSNSHLSTTYPMHQRCLDSNNASLRVFNPSLGFPAPPVLPSQHSDQEREEAQQLSPNQHQGTQEAQVKAEHHQELPDADFNLNESKSSELLASKPVEDMEEVDFHAFERSSAPSKLAAPSSSLAGRRQRRPAALGSTAFRSSSYNLSGPNSPHSTGMSGASDANLHRIKSSTAFGGRIQKTSQRSPFRRSFTEASDSPKPSSYTSNGPAAATNGDFVGVAPITPISEMNSVCQAGTNNGVISAPFETPDGDSKQFESLQYRLSRSAAPSVTSPWSAMPDTGATFDTARSYASPPRTPMDATRMASMHISNAAPPSNEQGLLASQTESHVPSAPLPIQQAPNSDPDVSQQRIYQFQSVAHSAPAWQQTFPSSVNGWPSAIHPPLQMPTHPTLLQPYFSHPSIGDGSGDMVKQNPHVSLPSGGHVAHVYGGQQGQLNPPMQAPPEFPIGQSRQAYMSGQPQMFHQLQPGIGNLVSPPGLAHGEAAVLQRPVSSSPVARSQPELQVHHYSPPHRAESATLPPKTRSNPQERREFNFQNVFSESFTSSSPGSS